ncbi:MAG: tetratricopeptide repeat protein [Candidatus Latescibacteria bacterium]|nr:tetratricopeptide repeat protein [Candidatus Latescibacterota bacterium]NIM64440.1 tetratricopeptide repeat protein [Candidatus Latescibacterota bacterium]NIO00594.1 tetratricopeptide repeat protein [Candidatus Latescibacterota bacterium]NIO26994.1 tetratricopeptide repeat protein [Candidatus Latescibacterota bacterium]NIO56071.1 tetratricopeptide repeat protein [Candidatus Latescibacterota bacterium]
MDRFEDAATELEAVRELAPHDESILFDLARVRLGEGRKGEAKALLTRALGLQPGDRAVNKLLREIENR